MADETILKTGNIEVSQTLVKIGKASYPVNAIGAVSISEPKTFGIYLAAVVSAVIGLVMAGEHNGGFPVLFIVGGLLLINAITKKSALVLATSSGDHKALLSNDKKFLESIKIAVEKAVSSRG